MLKLEFHPTADLESKEDRCIQYRSTAYNAAVARHLAPVEGAIYQRWWQFGKVRVMIVKGLTPPERAILAHRSWSRTNNPVAFCCDHSRFDRSITTDHLKIEHSVYAAMRSQDRELRMLLNKQLRNRGAFKTPGQPVRWRYTVKGKRMSGDFNTALGNSLINMLVLAHAFRKHPADVFVDGDDSFAILNKYDAPSFHAVIRDCRACGFQSKLETAHQLEHIEFCQARLVMTQHGPQFVRNPLKSLELLSISPRELKHQWEKEMVFNGKMASELAAYRDVPVMTPIAHRHYMPGQRLGFEDIRASQAYAARCIGLQKTTPDITAETRLSFERAWGIAPETQLLLEQLTFQLPAAKSIPPTPANEGEVGLVEEVLLEGISLSGDELHTRAELFYGDWPIESELSACRGAT